MFVRNRLNSGEYVTAVPQGLPITLQYDENGHIERVYIGYETTTDHASSKLLEKFLEYDSGPRTIPLLDGTTWIYGVLYTGEPVKITGKLPTDQISAYVNMYISGNVPFNFFAATMRTFAGKFQGAVQIIQWLVLAKFSKLPGITITKDTYDVDTHMWESLDIFPFRYPLISGFFINHSGSIRYESTGLFQCTVESIKSVSDAVGRITDLIVTSDGTMRNISCQETIKYDIQPGSTVVFTSDNSVIYSYPEDNLKPKSHNYYCPTCGRAINVPEFGVVMCPDTHCVSRLYPRIEQLLNTFGLPVISYSQYKELSSPRHGAFALADILDATEISKSHISCTLAKVLRAVIPFNIVPVQSSMLEEFCTKCNNSLHTLSYYLHNPRTIVTDLGLIGASRLVAWLEDGVNVSDILSILEHPHVEIILQGRKFDGPPIFRNKVIYVTGKFLHGGVDEIAAILTSYGASVVTEFSTDVDCVITGDTQEDVAGYAVQAAFKSRIPVFTEFDFFKKYEIDNDLS